MPSDAGEGRPRERRGAAAARAGADAQRVALDHWRPEHAGRRRAASVGSPALWPTSRCSFLTGRLVRYPPGPLPPTWRRRIGRGSPRRRSPPSSTARRPTSASRSPTASTSASSRPTPTRAATCCATRRPTCWPRRSSQLFPGAKYTIGPAIEDGFYYDFELPGGATFTEDDLAAIDARMREIIARRPAVRAQRGAGATRRSRLFADQPYKREIIERVRSGGADGVDADEVGAGDTISLYRNTPEFVDLCRGPHVPSTGRLGHFKLHEGGRRVLAGRREAARCCSASTARRGRATRRSRSTSTGWRRPRSATTASWPSSSTCCSFPERARRRAGGVAPEGRDQSAS